MHLHTEKATLRLPIKRNKGQKYESMNMDSTRKQIPRLKKQKRRFVPRWLNKTTNETFKLIDLHRGEISIYSLFYWRRNQKPTTHFIIQSLVTGKDAVIKKTQSDTQVLPGERSVVQSIDRGR